MHYPYEWVPYIVEIQVLRAGRLLILCVPGELTTMAGRRLKRAVQAAVRWGGGAGGWLWGNQGEQHLPHCRGVPFDVLCAATAAGPRLQVGAAWGEDLQIVIAGLTNTYASYVTTWEEYAVQRYEGGFTLYGPHTLDAYIQVGACMWVGMGKSVCRGVGERGCGCD